MLVRIHHRSSRRDVELVVHDPDARVADLVAAIAPDELAQTLLVDGRPRDPHQLLRRAALPPGAVLAVGQPEPLDPSPPVVELTSVAGPDAGRVWRLPPGRWALGRGGDVALDDPTVSHRHAQLVVAADGAATVADVGSRNGTRVGEAVASSATPAPLGSEVRLGRTRLRVDRPSDPVAVPTVGPSGPRPATRAVRTGGAGPRPPLEPPLPPEPAPGPSPVGVVAVVAPVVLGLVMVRLLHSWTFALFLLLSPVLVVGGALESRRRRTRTARRDRRRFAAALERFAAELAARAADEVDRQERRLLDPARVRRAGERWARRRSHADVLTVALGRGAVRWSPPVRGERRSWAPAVAEAVDAAAVLDDAPVPVDLGPGAVVGLVGDRSAVLRTARWLVVAAATQAGPADLQVAVLAGTASVAAWDWTKWLPHVADGRGGRRLATEPRDVRALATEVAAFGEEGPAALVVVDGLPPVSLRPGAGVGTIVLAGADDDLPDASTTVVRCEADGGATALDVATGTTIDLTPHGLADATAADLARSLGRWSDPEEGGAGRTLPASVALAPLLGLEPPSAAAIGARWRAQGTGGDALRARLGLTATGPLDLDLVADGPHALLAGTTGAGKSELLRTLVGALAAEHDPGAVTFLLVDFKGGSAFDACADLPHTVGVVTDLDDQLARRALRCLDAELHHRERVLRSAGVADLADLPPGEAPLPRLLVVVDEFATLVAELPDFVDALVGVAQRGRSLGLHLVLATQRPAGVVSDAIRANTDLRIALRVQDAHDSQDVLDRPDAAALPRGVPGRGLVRRGHGDVTPFQAAHSGAQRRTVGPVELRPAPFGPGLAPTGAPGRTTDLHRIVAAANEAWAASGRAAPRRPWLPPLPERVPLPSVLDADLRGLPFALADEPDHQRQRPWAWDPACGPLLVVGINGAGRTRTAAAVVVAAAHRHRPDDLHIDVLDLGSGLGGLASLPHLGSLVAAAELERQGRLLDDLSATVARRTADPDTASGVPQRLLVVDGLGALRATWGEADPDGRLDQLLRLALDGTRAGVHLVITAERPGAVPAALLGAARQRLVLRLGDRLDVGAFGLAPSDVPDLPPGRGLWAEGSVLLQVADVGDDLDVAARTAAARWPTPAADRRPRRIGTLPNDVLLTDLAPHPSELVLGVDGATLEAATVPLHPGDHLLVAGPPRSGRTTALATLLASLAARPDPPDLVVAGEDPLVPEARTVARDRLAGLRGRDGERPTVVAIDDVDRWDADDPVLTALVAAGAEHLHVIAAGRADTLRQRFGTWSRDLRASRTGLLLDPDADLDGDLLACHLPRRPSATVPGRGWLVVAGRPRLVQVARTG